MAREGEMKPSVMLENIRRQPDSLACVADQAFGEGFEALRAAAAAIRSAKSVVFTGMGSSMSASIPAAYFLEQHGIAAEVVETSEWLHFGRAARRGEAMVLVSRSGETIEITKLLARLHESTSVTVGVTNVADSRLARESDHSLFLGSEADRMVAIQTYTGTMALLLLLSILTVQPNEASLRKEVDAAGSAMSAAIEQAVAQSDEWLAFLERAEVVHLLGRGPSLASAREGALLFNEAARTPAVGMSAALFRHGPVEIVDERFRAIVFASQRATNDIDVALAMDLEAMRGKVRVCEAGAVSSPFEPLVEIVPIQVAACALAISKGIDPGDFRHATLVTLSESGF
jgi:glucosamine--fructose-6-phosphate aminotransferase (isomerizing)